MKLKKRDYPGGTMAFFAKLKERLFKSSSKLEEGLDAIVDNGGVIEEADQGHLKDLTQETTSQDIEQVEIPGELLDFETF